MEFTILSSERILSYMYNISRQKKKKCINASYIFVMEL